jgi:predicted nucleotidyltransferase
MGSTEQNLPPILPVGTAVVGKTDVKGRGGAVTVPAGAVGRIIQSPVDADHSYRVRFVGGEEVMLRRSELAVLSHFQQAGITAGPDAMAEYDLHRYVIYRCIVGSRAYGLEGAESDYDRRGVYLPPAEMHWSLFGVPEQLENQETDECYWELQKFLTLALKANPNVLEVLYTPLVELATGPAEELLAMREKFLSKLVYQTYNGYVMSQFSKLEQDIRNRGAIKWKHAMHLVRLLLSGITILREKYVPVRVTELRERLLAIRDGLENWDEVNRWRLELNKQFEQAYAATTLPDRPDYEAANALLVRARRSMVK